MNQCLVALLALLLNIGTTQCCDDGWTEYRGACFKLFTDTVAFNGATTGCTDLGGVPIMPKTAGTQNLIQGMMLDQQEADFWLYTIRSPHLRGGWTFLDGTLLADCDFTNWGPAHNGEASSNDGANTEQCAKLFADTQWAWEDTGCGSTASYICQIGDVVGTGEGNCGTSSAHNANCNGGWTAGPGDLCYKASDSVATHEAAAADCEAQGGRLAAPYDERSHQFIAGMAMRANPDSDHWIGIIADEDNGGFKFIDDTQLPQCGFMKWADVQPDRSMCCGYLDSAQAYKWAAGETSSERHYICQSGTGYTCDEGNTGCAAGEFACPCNGCCLTASLLCDGQNDCSDGSDEDGCPAPTTEAATTTTPAVPTTTLPTTAIPTTTTTNIMTTAASNDDVTDGSTIGPSTASGATTRSGQGGTDAENTAGVPVGAVAGAVVGVTVVVGVGAGIGYLLYKKQLVALVEPIT